MLDPEFEKGVKFIRNIHFHLSQTSKSEAEKLEILMGALAATGISAEEVIKYNKNKYSMADANFFKSLFLNERPAKPQETYCGFKPGFLIGKSF